MPIVSDKQQDQTRQHQRLLDLPVVKSVGVWADRPESGLEIVTTHYRIYTTLNDRLILLQVPTFLESAWQEYNAVIERQGREMEPMPVYLFADRGEWEDFTRHWAGVLAQLYLAHSRPDEAENHVDEAHLHGIGVPDGYRQVGALYEEQGRSADAFRAYMKAMRQGEQLAEPGAKPIENLRAAFEDLL